ncbi:hypothetical protein ACFL03_03190 [Thermodesulfobacteriota bacterium]
MNHFLGIDPETFYSISFSFYMEHLNNVIYLTCTRHKSLQKKHIDVCRQCQWNTTCEPYQEYYSSEAATEGKKPLPTGTAQPIPEDLSDYIKNELKGIVTLLENQSPIESKAPPRLKTDPLFQDDVLEGIKEELREIRTLC